MKKIFIIVFTLLSSLIYSQEFDIDTVKWIDYNNRDLPFRFAYPRFFIEDNYSRSEESFNSVSFSFVDKSETYMVSDSSVYHLEYFSSFTILISDEDSTKIADYFGYIIKDGIWYDSYALESPFPESAEYYVFTDWKGYVNVVPASVYFAEGGAFSHGADDDRYVLMKKVDLTNVLYVFAQGFRLDFRQEVLKRICNSIIIR